MSGIHITNGYGFSSRIAKVSTSHRTDANDTLAQMITSSKISFAPQYLSRDNREGSGCNHRLFEKVAPRSLIRFQHVYIINVTIIKHQSIIKLYHIYLYSFLIYSSKKTLSSKYLSKVNRTRLLGYPFTPKEDTSTSQFLPMEFIV